MKRWARVIDCGGSGFRRADVSSDDEIVNLVESTTISNPEELVEFAVEDLPAGVEGVIYACAGVNRNHMIVVSSPHISFLRETNLAQMTWEKIGKGRSSVVLGDMEASTYGVAKLFPELDDFMNITWSSGIGMRIWKRRGIVSDSEASHIVLDRSPDAPLCPCGLRGCVDAVIGGKGVTREVIARTQARSIGIPEGMHPCRYWDQEVEKMTPWALDLYRVVVDGMAAFLATIQSIVDPKAIVWKGTFAKAFLTEKNIAVIRRLLEEKIFPKEWVKNLTFYFTPEPPVNKDAFIGGAAFLFSLPS